MMLDMYNLVQPQWPTYGMSIVLRHSSSVTHSRTHLLLIRRDQMWVTDSVRHWQGPDIQFMTFLIYIICLHYTWTILHIKCIITYDVYRYYNIIIRYSCIHPFTSVFIHMTRYMYISYKLLSARDYVFCALFDNF